MEGGGGLVVVEGGPQSEHLFLRSGLITATMTGIIKTIEPPSVHLTLWSVYQSAIAA